MERRSLPPLLQLLTLLPAICCRRRLQAGVFGGIPSGGLRFGSAHNPACLIPTASMIDFYSGSGVDLACLGLAEVCLDTLPVPMDRGARGGERGIDTGGPTASTPVLLTAVPDPPGPCRCVAPCRPTARGMSMSATLGRGACRGAADS